LAEWSEEAFASLEQRRRDDPDGDHDLEEPPPEVAGWQLEVATAARARRWIALGDLLSLLGRYLHDVVEVQVADSDGSSLAGSLMGSTMGGLLGGKTVRKTVARARTVAEEEALPQIEAQAQQAASYNLPYDSVRMAASLFEAVDKEKTGRVAAYHLKIMFRRLSWRTGVKPTNGQIDDIIKVLGFSGSSAEPLTVYDWLFMVEFIASNKKENSFFGQFGRAISSFGYMDVGADDDVEEEHWEKQPLEGWKNFMATMRIQGVDAPKEKVKVRASTAGASVAGFAPLGDGSRLRPPSFDDKDATASRGKGAALALTLEEAAAVAGWSHQEELERLMNKGSGVGAAEKDRMRALMGWLAEADKLAELTGLGGQLSPDDAATVKDLMAAARERDFDRDEALARANDKLKAAGADGGDEAVAAAASSAAAPGDESLDPEGAAKAAGVLASLSAAAKGTKAKGVEGGLGGGFNVTIGADEDEEKGGEGAEETKEGGEDEVANEAGSAADLAKALARSAAARATKAAETAADRAASATFTKYSTGAGAAGGEGRGGERGAALADGFITGQRALVAALGACGFDPSTDLRVALLVDAFTQALLALPANVRLATGGGGGAAAILIGREHFLRLIEQCRRFPVRQRRVTREDLEPEEIFVISDPLAHGFVTMKKVRRIVSSMGLNPRDPAVAAQLQRLGRECAEDHYVVTYDRFIVFVERCRHDLQGLGVASVLDVDLSKASRAAARDVKATRAEMAEKSRLAAEAAGVELGPRARAKAKQLAEEAKAGELEGLAGTREYVAALSALLDQTEDWEAKPPAERERALNLLRIHVLEAGKRRKSSEGAALSLEKKIDRLHDRAMRQTAYAREYAVDKLKAEAAGVPPTPRAPARPREPPLTARVMDQLALKREEQAAEVKKLANAAASEADFRAKHHIPAEPSSAPSAGVFDKKGYIKELNGKAAEARKAFEARAKDFDPYAEDPSARAALEDAAKKCIRLYVQIGGLEPIPSAPTFNIGMVHKRLGNLTDAVACFENVIDVDPTGKCADTATAWDLKGTLLLQLGAKPADVAYCFGQAIALAPADGLFKKHLRDCEAAALDPMHGVKEGPGGGEFGGAAVGAAEGEAKKKKKKKTKK